MSTDSTERAVGRAKTVVMSGTAGEAAITTVVAQVRKHPKNIRIRNCGGISLSAPTLSRIETSLLHIVDEITSQLGVAKRCFDLTVLNLDGVSAKDVPATISGHSADLPMFMCLLSAALPLPLKQNVVATGELGSLAGDITMVSGIPAKVAAAAEDPKVTLFLYPSLDRDHSLVTLAPNERDKIQEALVVATAHVRTVPVLNIADALEHFLDDDAVTLCSLQQGFWNRSGLCQVEDTPLQQAVLFLGTGNENRFWRALEGTLSAGDNAQSHRLLDAFVRYHVSRKTYPAGFGAKLFDLIHSLPPATRRLKIQFPLIPVENCIALSQFAGRSHHEDLRLLNKICFENAKAFESPHFIQQERVDIGEQATGEAAVTVLLEELSPETIAVNVCNPIDEARNHFHPNSIQVDSPAECLEIAAALYCQLQRYSVSGSSGMPLEIAEQKTLDLLEEAFAHQGGIDAAYTEACQPTRLGGMLHVLRLMTECYKAKAIRKHLLWVIRKGVDPLNREHVAFAQEVKRRFAPFLSPKDIEPDAEVLATKWEDLARAYAHSLDAVKMVLRKR